MYLGFDLGTTNVKALVTDASGRIVGAGSAPVERSLTADGGVEQDIEQIWGATGVAIVQTLAGCDRRAVRAVGVSSQGGALQVLDGREEPLGRVISWLDARGRAFDEELVAELGRDFLARHVGHGGSTMALGQVLRLNRESPRLLRAPRRLGFVGDVIVGRLCARRAHDPTSLGIAPLYNPWLGQADPEILARLELAEDQLPALVPATVAAGPLSAEAAQRFGLPSGIPVSPAVHDQYAAALGAGAVGAGDVNFGSGTAWVLLANTASLVAPLVDQAFACCHVVPGLWGQLISLGNGGSAVDWVMRLVGRQRASPAEVDAWIAQSAPGSAGLRCWPLLVHGSQTPAPFQAGGRLERLSLAHRPCDVVRAVVEGLACELARHLRLLTAAGLPVARLSMCGSATASRTTPQILADLLDVPVTRVQAADVSALGAAMIARSLDCGEGLAEVGRRWSEAGQAVDPGAGRSVYRDLLEEYLAAFETRPVWAGAR